METSETYYYTAIPSCLSSNWDNYKTNDLVFPTPYKHFLIVKYRFVEWLDQNKNHHASFKYFDPESCIEVKNLSPEHIKKISLYLIFIYNVVKYFHKLHVKNIFGIDAAVCYC